MEKVGWVSLHRKIRDNPIYKNSKAVHCWIECLLRANHDPSNFYLGRKNINLKPGEFIFGRDEFGKSIGVSGSTVWFWLQRFEVDSMLDIKKTSKGCIGYIKNWENYQTLDSNVDSKKTTKKQQITTDNNDNNDNKDINIIAEVHSASKEANLILNIFYEINPGINFANKSFRKSAEWLIQKFGCEKAQAITSAAVKAQGQRFAPTITNPSQLKEKLAALNIFYGKTLNQPRTIDLDNL